MIRHASTSGTVSATSFGVHEVGRFEILWRAVVVLLSAALFLAALALMFA